MAEVAVSLALEKLGDALIKEDVLLHGVRGQVEWLYTELRKVESFLKDADAKGRDGDERVKIWVRQVIEVAHRAEDMIDSFILETVVHRRRLRRSRGGCVNTCVGFPFGLRPRRKMSAEMKELRSMIEEINSTAMSVEITVLRSNIEEINSEERRVDFGLTKDEAVGTISYADDPLLARRKHGIDDYGDDTGVVGFVTNKEMILKYVLNTNDITRRCVISIVGMGGIGKTTLAKGVYKSREIRERHFFDAWAWVSVSQDYRVSQILKSIAEQVMEYWMEEDDVIREKLHQFLRNRRYFIVLDDVWSSNVWEQIRAVLPDMNNGSRVLITTRNTDVARSADPRIPPYQLPLLREEESWQLFLLKTFPRDPTSCPKELEEISRKLVKRCQGLPLALVVLGSILSTKDPNPAKWRRAAERMVSGEEDHSLVWQLRLSYDDLPHYRLRLCFLYLGSFPEDSVMDSSKLIRLWIAEGFIPHNDRTEAIEETARGYLEELAQRSMIQVVDKDPTDGSITRFQLHDLFRDMCLHKAREDGFFTVYERYNMMRRDPTRHLALHNLTADDVNGCWPPSNLSSLLLFDTQIASREILNGLKLLRVIHFEGAASRCGFEILPEEITRMIHLRYLGLRGCRDLRGLPASIGNLYNLRTLDVADTSISQLPKALGRIKTLTHMYLPDSCDCPPIFGGNLTSLHANARGGWINPRLGEFVKIRDLRVTGLKLDQAKVFFDLLRKIDGLSSLELLYTELIFIELITGLSNSNHLGRLILDGIMSEGQLPGDAFPSSLTKLTLRRSELNQDPMAVLEKLPKLVFLELDVMSYVGKVMVCSAGGFPRLRSLVLLGLNGLEEWMVQDGAMPNLTYLTIKYCWRLKMIPDGLRHLTSLQELEVYDDREEFRRRLMRQEGEDWHKIQHVRFITVKDRPLE